MKSLLPNPHYGLFTLPLQKFAEKTRKRHKRHRVLRLLLQHIHADTQGEVQDQREGSALVQVFETETDQMLQFFATVKSSFNTRLFWD